MKSTWFALVAGCSLASAGAAVAQQTNNPTGAQDTRKGGETGMTGGSSTGEESTATTNKVSSADEPKKHLSEIDAYLKDSMNNVKVLYGATQLQPSRVDTMIDRESLSNVDRAITSALNHVSHLKSMPEAQVADMTRLNEFQRELMDARATVARLRTAVKSDARSQIQTLSSQLYTQLRSADDLFSDIATKQNLVRVDHITVPEKQPSDNVPSGSQMQNPNVPDHGATSPTQNAPRPTGQPY